MERINFNTIKINPHTGNPIKEITDKELCEIDCARFNSQVGYLKGLDCPICKNKGDIKVLRYSEGWGYDVTVQRCNCMVKRKLLEKAENNGLGQYIYKSFPDFKTDAEWQQAVKQKAMQYIEANNHEWFIALGQSGSGKTLICSIIANNLLLEKNRNVMCITWTDFIGRLKRDMMGDNTNAVSGYLEEIKNADVLFIDELLKKYNDTDLRYCIEIINYRYTKGFQTIITSERNMNELLEIDEATFSRVREMVGKNMVIVPKNKDMNYRLRKK